MASILNEIKQEFRKENMVTQLIMINVAVFLFMLLVRLFFMFAFQDRAHSSNTFFNFLSWFAVPYDLTVLITRPWTLITNMFLQYEIWHLFWNMVFLYWFGRVLREYIGNRKILPVYVYGGLLGYAASMTFYYIFPSLPIGEMALGSSAAVYAILFALATLVPNFSFHLIFIGPVKVKYIVAFRVVIDLLYLANMENMGGNIAHLGGGLLGYLFISRHRKGKDMSIGFNRFMDRLVSWLKPSRRSRMKTSYSNKRRVPDEAYNVRRKARQEEIDTILDKISKSGYESLSAEEKELLFKHSKDD